MAEKKTENKAKSTKEETEAVKVTEEMLEKEVDKKIEDEKKKAEEVTQEMFEKADEINDNAFSETGNVVFPCPQCGKEIIKRTLHERKIATKYKCSKCGFEGPN